MAPRSWNRINAQALRNFETQVPKLDAIQREALSAMRHDGVYATTVNEFTSDKTKFAAVRRDADMLMARPALQRQIESRLSTEGIKWYVVRAFGYRPRLPIPASFANLLLDDRVLSVVNSYLGVTSRLIYLDVWHNFAVSASEPPVDSEMWHRDNEDRNIIKLFVHLSDVDEAAGPLTYVLGSQPGGPHGDLFPNDSPIGSFPSERKLEDKLPEDSIKPCTGAPSTMLFFDACGLHRGGRATGKARSLLVATYASDASIDLLKYKLAQPDQLATMSQQARYALYAPSD